MNGHRLILEVSKEISTTVIDRSQSTTKSRAKTRQYEGWVG
ncbi:hypothetical protein ACFC96_35460 [Streptomyces sp. NPDC055955]